MGNNFINIKPFPPFFPPWILGPSHWKEVFPVANGDRQSPIDIKTTEAKYDPSLRPISPNYDPTSAKVILNNGHSTSVEFDDAENKSGLFCL